ncbi:PspC domain-containing protein [Rhodococcus marinonascens]|uniref:PspC domain-containing protein n=1 Tax=Rhodococcus marinonascens TaxID=38311 RepID=UPI0009334D79|nr:PspC domain-containing protein [Rhodococcus marinonascens]
MNNGSFQEQMQDLWRTRPVRLPGRGHVAGVCTGIGYRYRVDPVLIRAAFVVSTVFGGAGVLLYLACWLTLTKSGDPASPAESLMGRGHSSDSGTKTIVLLVALAIAASTVGPIGVGLGGSGVISMALMLGGLWLLYQRQPIPPPLPAETGVPGVGTGYPGTGYPRAGFSPGHFSANQFSANQFGPGAYMPSTTSTPDANSAEAPANSATAKPAAAESNPVSFEKNPATSPRTEPPSVPFTPIEPQPPAWDPLGAAPFAWDLPEPAQDTIPAPQPERRRSRLTTVVIGLAIIAAAGATALSVLTGSDWLNPGRIGAIALAVVGVGMLIGGFLRKGYGLLVVAGPLIGFVVLASLVGSVDLGGEDVGDRTWTPVTAAGIEPAYFGKFGSFTLDLTNVTLTEDKTVDVSGTFGEVEVILPPAMDVENHCTVLFGDSQCLADGIDGGADGADGHLLTLNADVKFGSVEVRRG